MLTPARPAFWQIGLTHGNNRTTTQNKMRTKTLLLSAAALLAAGFVSSQAQPVYSQNIVGYANVPTPLASTYYTVFPAHLDHCALYPARAAQWPADRFAVGRWFPYHRVLSAADAAL